MAKLPILFAAGSLLFMSMLTLEAQKPVKELLWPDGAPESKGSDPKKDTPSLLTYAPAADKANGTAVVVCPGGGYHGLANGHEGHDIDEWFASLGVTAVILDYRRGNGGYKHPVPLMDAQRAIRTVRSKEKSLKIDPDKVGIMGFSAGSHLASTTGTHFDLGNPQAKDPINKQSSRPNFMILCYPVITFGQDSTHMGSQRNLIGESPDKELINNLSNDKQVNSETPPTFLFHTDEDTLLPPENSVQLYLALRKAKVPAELHIYRKGRHGVGLAHKMAATNAWSSACEEWMRGYGWLEK